MKSLTIRERVKKIGAGAFSDCIHLRRVMIPESVEDIGQFAFHGCKELADEDGFIIVNNVLFGYIGSAENMVIPDGVKRLDWMYFADNKAMKSVIIPDSVESIGEGAFSGCINLEKAVLPENVRLGNKVFEGCVKLTDR